MQTNLPNYTGYKNARNIKRAAAIGASVLTLAGATVGISTCARSCSRNEENIDKVIKILESDADVGIYDFNGCEYHKVDGKYYVIFNCKEDANVSRYEERKDIVITYSVSKELYNELSHVQTNGGYVFYMGDYDETKGDIITKIEAGNKILATDVTKQSIINFFNSKELEEGQTVKITYDRGEEKGLQTEIEVYSKTILDTQNIPATKLQLGIVCANGFNLKKLLYMPFIQTGESFTMIFKTIGALFSDSSVGVDDLSGPVGIFNLLKNATKEGILTILSWTAILSVNIGFMNLLPLPALDGGRIAFMAYEAVTRRKPNAKVENTIHAIGFILLMGLMLFVSFNDVLRCIGCR